MMAIDRWKCEECAHPCELAVHSPPTPARQPAKCPLFTWYRAIWQRVHDVEAELAKPDAQCKAEAIDREDFADQCVEAGKIAEGRDVLDAMDNQEIPKPHSDATAREVD